MSKPRYFSNESSESKLMKELEKNVDLVFDDYSSNLHGDNDMIIQFFHRDIRDNKNILILYHGDLDGAASAFVCAEAVISTTVNEVNIVLRKVNHNYDNEYFDCKGYGLVFLVDFSITKERHLNTIMESMDENSRLIWIDHHISSYDIVNGKNDIYKVFMKFDKMLYHFIYTEEGLSAAALCFFVLRRIFFEAGVHYSTFRERVLCIDDHMETILNDIEMRNMYYDKFPIPELIARVSLYDTFHELSDPRFYYGIGSNNYFAKTYPIKEGIVEYDREDFENYHTSRFLYTWLTMISSVKSDILEGMFIPITRYRSSLMNLHEIKNDDVLNLYDMLKVGKIILDYETQSNKIYRSNTLKEIIIKDNVNDDTFSCCVINKKSNSFIFGDEYYKHDCVMVFYFTNTGDYIYSIYANLKNHHRPNCKKIAEQFGGGGHEGAAGFTLNYNIFENKTHLDPSDTFKLIFDKDISLDKK